jgi:hypothetical protein
MKFLEQVSSYSHTVSSTPKYLIRTLGLYLRVGIEHTYNFLGKFPIHVQFPVPSRLVFVSCCTSLLLVTVHIAFKPMNQSIDDHIPGSCLHYEFHLAEFM